MPAAKWAELHVDTSLAGKVALVTGGSRGLGREICTQLAAAGCDIVVASRKLPACERAAAEIAAVSGRRALGIACHVGSWDDCARLVAATYDAFGRLDVLINNAGVAPASLELETMTEELFDKIIAVNLKGPFRLSALVGRRMQAQGGGVIVNISSSAATHPLPAAIAYSMAKGAVNTMTKALAALLGPSVRVNCVQPWGIVTDMSKHIPVAQIERLASTHAIRRFARPEEVASAVVFLAGGASSFTTGAVLRVDGGMPG